MNGFDFEKLTKEDCSTIASSGKGNNGNAPIGTDEVRVGAYAKRTTSTTPAHVVLQIGRNVLRDLRWRIGDSFDIFSDEESLYLRLSEEQTRFRLRQLNKNSDVGKVTINNTNPAKKSTFGKTFSMTATEYEVKAGALRVKIPK